MKLTKKIILFLFVTSVLMFILTGCDFEQSATTEAQQASAEEREVAQQVQQRLIEAQPLPTDIEASLERHNIIRRSYWINGMRERAIALPSPISNPPLGYVILFAPNGGVIGSFPVEGKVTSLNYSLVPYSEYWEIGHQRDRNSGQGATFQQHNRWIANPGGVYGTNTNGIFWFTPCGKYMEWNGTYLFSDIPFLFEEPILNINMIGE